MLLQKNLMVWTVHVNGKCNPRFLTGVLSDGCFKLYLMKYRSEATLLFLNKIASLSLVGSTVFIYQSNVWN